MMYSDDNNCMDSSSLDECDDEMTMMQAVLADTERLDEHVLNFELVLHSNIYFSLLK